MRHVALILAVVACLGNDSCRPTPAQCQRAERVLMDEAIAYRTGSRRYQMARNVVERCRQIDPPRQYDGDPNPR